jgi:hypothetical protein
MPHFPPQLALEIIRRYPYLVRLLSARLEIHDAVDAVGYALSGMPSARNLIGKAFKIRHSENMNRFRFQKTPESKCMNCGEVYQGALNTHDGRSMTPGDIAVCVMCGHLNALGDDMKLRELTGAEFLKVAGDPRIIETQSRRPELKAIIERHKKRKESKNA